VPCHGGIIEGGTFWTLASSLKGPKGKFLILLPFDWWKLTVYQPLAISRSGRDCNPIRATIY